MTVLSAHRMITAALTCLALAALAQAQEAPCARRTIPVSVFDERGQPVAGLTSGDFTAKVKKKLATIVSAHFDRGARRVVVVLDSSGSMSWLRGKWNLASLLASDALRASPGKFRAGLVVFNDRVRVKVLIQPDSQAALAALRSIDPAEKNTASRPRGKTALWDALQEAEAMLQPAEFGDAVYVVTDGGENNSRSSLKDIRKHFLEGDIRLFAAVFGPENPPGTAVEDSGPDDLVELVRDSGGLLIPISPTIVPLSPSLSHYDLNRKERDILADRVLIIYGAIQWVYRLDVALPEVPKKPESWKLAVTQPRDQKTQRLLEYPQHLAVCTNTTADEK
jgi:von Willebrand factor type A domain